MKKTLKYTWIIIPLLYLLGMILYLQFSYNPHVQNQTNNCPGPEYVKSENEPTMVIDCFATDIQPPLFLNNRFASLIPLQLNGFGAYYCLQALQLMVVLGILQKVISIIFKKDVYYK